MGTEVNLWDWLKPYLPKGKYDRIETPDTAPGTPDVHYRISEGGGWMELKVADHDSSDVPFPDDKKGLHKTQRIWFEEFIEFGGRAFIVAQIGNEILFIPGKYYKAFNGSTRKRLYYFATLVIDRSDPGPSLKKLKRLLSGE